MVGLKFAAASCAVAVAVLLVPVTPLAISEKHLSLELDAHLDSLEGLEDFPHPVAKREASASHLVKREAHLRSLTKRQASDTSDLEKLLFRTSVMYLEAFQAFDPPVLDAVIAVADQINATIRTGRSSPSIVNKFTKTVDAIAANVSANSVLPNDCGRDPKLKTGLLQGSLPWFARVGFLRGDSSVVGCVGVIVSRYHVLVAASCAAGSNYDVVFTSNGPHKIAEKWIHPTVKSADDLKKGHNIGLIMVKDPFVFNDDLQPSCIPGLNDEISPFRQFEATLVGIEEAQTGVRVYNWPKSRTAGPLLCFEVIRNLNRENPTKRNSFEDELRTSHLCAFRPYEEADLSLVMRQNPQSGRVETLGVGPLADPQASSPIVYTQVQSHLFWIELLVKNSIKLLV